MGKRLIGFLICLLLFPALAQAATLTLPASVTTIADSAFEGDLSLTEAVLPEGITTIGARAFADSGLTDINLPESLTAIGDEAFEGCEGLVALVQPCSLAEQYCLAHGITTRYDTAPVYRALIIGQTDYQATSVSNLTAPSYDANGVSRMLATQTATPYTTSLHLNVSSSEMLSLIGSTFAGASGNDVSLLYYAGHGAYSGQLYCVDGGYLSPATLRAALDQIPGKKIVVIDACYSGGLIGRTASTLSMEGDTDGVSAFVSGFLSAFTGLLRTRSSSDLADDAFYVITACRSTELSYEWSGTTPYGLFSNQFNLAGGWDQQASQITDMAGDTDGDSCLSVTEAAVYARSGVSAFLDDYNSTHSSTITSVVQYYLGGDDIVLCGR